MGQMAVPHVLVGFKATFGGENSRPGRVEKYGLEKIGEYPLN